MRRLGFFLAACVLFVFVLSCETDGQSSDEDSPFHKDGSFLRFVYEHDPQDTVDFSAAQISAINHKIDPNHAFLVIAGAYFSGDDLRKGGLFEREAKKVAKMFTHMPVVRDFLPEIDIFIYMKDWGPSVLPEQGIEGSDFDYWDAARKEIQERYGYARTYPGILIANGAAGGWAYLGHAALYSIDGEPSPFYWTMHEFFGHAWSALYDEYYPHGYDENYVQNDPSSWLNLQALMLTGGTEKMYPEFDGEYEYDSGNFRPIDDSFMCGNPRYAVSAWHRLVAWRRIRGWTGKSTELSDFIEYDAENRKIDWISNNGQGYLDTVPQSVKNTVATRE